MEKITKFDAALYRAIGRDDLIEGKRIMSDEEAEAIQDARVIESLQSMRHADTGEPIIKPPTKGA